MVYNLSAHVKCCNSSLLLHRALLPVKRVMGTSECYNAIIPNLFKTSVLLI